MPIANFDRRSSRCFRMLSVRSPTAAPEKTSMPSSYCKGVFCSECLITISLSSSSIMISEPGFKPMRSRICFGNTSLQRSIPMKSAGQSGERLLNAGRGRDGGYFDAANICLVRPVIRIVCLWITQVFKNMLLEKLKIIACNMQQKKGHTF